MKRQYRNDRRYPSDCNVCRTFLSYSALVRVLDPSNREKKDRWTGHQDMDHGILECLSHTPTALPKLVQNCRKKNRTPLSTQIPDWLWDATKPAVPGLASLLARLLSALSLKFAFPDAPKFSPLLPPQCFQARIFQDTSESQIWASWNRRCL